MIKQKQIGPVAQLVRAPACHAGGQGFEPPSGRQKFARLYNRAFFYPSRKQSERFVMSSHRRCVCNCKALPCVCRHFARSVCPIRVLVTVSSEFSLLFGIRKRTPSFLLNSSSSRKVPLAFSRSFVFTFAGTVPLLEKPSVFLDFCWCFYKRTTPFYGISHVVRDDV